MLKAIAGILLLAFTTFAAPAVASPTPDDRYFDSGARQQRSAKPARVTRYAKHRHRAYRQRSAYRSARKHRRYAAPPTRHRRYVEAQERVTGPPATETPRMISTRPMACPARLWCGCYLANLFGLPERGLWLARNWLNKGTAVAGPVPGAVVVYARGRRGGHVGKITEVSGNRIKVLSGNDGNRVRERWRTVRGVIGYRML